MHQDFNQFLRERSWAPPLLNRRSIAPYKHRRSCVAGKSWIGGTKLKIAIQVNCWAKPYDISFMGIVIPFNPGDLVKHVFSFTSPAHPAGWEQRARQSLLSALQRVAWPKCKQSKDSWWLSGIIAERATLRRRPEESRRASPLTTPSCRLK